MGFLSRLFKSEDPGLTTIPAGSFTIDKDGAVITSTLPQSFPAAHRDAIGQQVLASLNSAKKARMPFNEIVVQYSALKLVARELRGGAIVFLSPQSMDHSASTKIKKSP